MDKIVFQGKSYPVTYINMPFGKRMISNEQLNDALMNYDGSYVSNEAKVIDEKIFYFVNDEVLGLSEIDVVDKILSEI